jgi:hypothetical protein
LEPRRYNLERGFTDHPEIFEEKLPNEAKYPAPMLRFQYYTLAGYPRRSDVPKHEVRFRATTEHNDDAAGCQLLKNQTKPNRRGIVGTSSFGCW